MNGLFLFHDFYIYTFKIVIYRVTGLNQTRIGYLPTLRFRYHQIKRAYFIQYFVL